MRRSGTPAPVFGFPRVPSQPRPQEAPCSLHPAGDAAPLTWALLPPPRLAGPAPWRPSPPRCRPSSGWACRRARRPRPRSPPAQVWLQLLAAAAGGGGLPAERPSPANPGMLLPHTLQACSSHNMEAAGPTGGTAIARRGAASKERFLPPAPLRAAARFWPPCPTRPPALCSRLPARGRQAAAPSPPCPATPPSCRPTAAAEPPHAPPAGSWCVVAVPAGLCAVPEPCSSAVPHQLSSSINCSLNLCRSAAPAFSSPFPFPCPPAPSCVRAAH